MELIRDLGALSFIDNEKVVYSCDMPILETQTRAGKGRGKRTKIIRELNGLAVKDLFETYAPRTVYIEKAQAMTSFRKGLGGEVEAVPQEVSSTARYMKAAGILEGICIGMGIPYQLITPQAWKKVLMPGMPKEKSASIIKVGQLYPELKLIRKKDHGICDSILIGLAGIRLNK